MSLKRLLTALKAASRRLSTRKSRPNPEDDKPDSLHSTRPPSRQSNQPTMINAKLDYGIQDRAIGQPSALSEQHRDFPDGWQVPQIVYSSLESITPVSQPSNDTMHEPTQQQILQTPGKMAKPRSTQDMRFTIREERPLPGSTQRVFDDAGIQEARQQGAGPYVAPVTAFSETVIDDADAIDGTFRTIHVRYDGDPTGERAMCQRIMHDTGSHCSLIFESKIKALDLDFESIQYSSTLVSVTGEHFRPIGIRQIRFSYFDIPETIHWATLVVLRDPGHGLPPNFDILLGRDTIRKTKALSYDKGVVGANFVGQCIPTLRPPSIASQSELAPLPEDVAGDCESSTEELEPVLGTNWTTPATGNVLDVIGTT